MDITIFAACPVQPVQVTFDQVQAALAFMQMLAHNITPDLFVKALQAIMGTPDAGKAAQDIVNACYGPAA